MRYRISLVSFVFIIAMSCKKDVQNDNLTITVSIKNIYPGTGSYGTIVTIVGAGLSEVDTVELNGKSCVISKKTTDTLMISIPKGAGSGDIRIIAGDSVFIAGNFDFHFTSYVTTIAGSQNIGSVDGVGLNAGFYLPAGLAWDSSGKNIIIAEYSNTPRLRKLNPSGEVTTFSGSGKVGYVDGSASIAEFGMFESSLISDPHGNFYVIDYYYNRIRKITPNGTVTTFAGNDTIGTTDGPVSVAKFNKLDRATLTSDSKGNIYVTDGYNHNIRKITADGMVTTVAGKPDRDISVPVIDGSLAEATFIGPDGMTFDSKGNIYVTDEGLIRKITPDGIISTMNFSGLKYNGAVLMDPNDNLYYLTNNAIQKITADGKVITLTGNPENNGFGMVDGPIETALFNGIAGVIFDKNGDIYLSDSFNHRIRKVVIQ